MAPNLNRRQFHSLAGSAFTALLASGCVARAPKGASEASGYGPLIHDPAGLIDLPQGFIYRVISTLGDMMDDGEAVPDGADGMGTFQGKDGRVILIRNHELEAQASGLTGTAYDRWNGSGALPGGTTTIVYNPATGLVEEQFRSLAGTINNCAGGTTPWRTWLSCEEDSTLPGDSVGKTHGWVFEVPADLRGRAAPIPLTGLGRFEHEAAAVDPRTGIVYLTEDRKDSLFYRFVPNRPGRLSEGGRLQALALVDGRRDSRNWTSAEFLQQRPAAAHWIDLTDTDSANDDLRNRGAAQGALLLARGEGIHMGRDELYFTCTSGGAAKLGQIMRYRPAPRGMEAGGSLELFFESTSPDQFDYGDNLTIGPNGHLFVCEDKESDIGNHIRGIQPDGKPYPFARLRIRTELAGVCFAPDGRTLFVNAQNPTKTLAISGRFA